jgi:two-component system response regulator CpxR
MNDQLIGSGSRVLLIDDDAELCELVTQYLTARGFLVETRTDGETGFESAQSGRYSILVLDVMLPGIDGFEVLRRLRSGPTARLPVVMLTAHGDEVDRIVGLELGADDYLSKPFNPRELLARISAVLRRASAGNALQAAQPIPTTPIPATPAPTIPVATAPSTSLETSPPVVIERLQVGDVEINLAARSVRRAGEIVELTAVEFELLHVLLRGAGRVALRDELAREALQRKLLPFDRSLDMHISKLRRKLGPDPEGGERIKTLRGIGYIYVRDAL